MEITHHSNGPEGTENPSTQRQTTIQTPDNGFYQQSLYVVAIAQFIGCEGLASAVTDERDGIKYTFDFYHAECGKVFKVLKSGDLREYEKYVQYPGDGFVIVDAGDHPGCQAGECACCGERHIILPHELGEKLHDTDATYLYFRGLLCEYLHDAKDDRSHWLVLEPLVLREEEDDESDCCDEEDED